MFFFCRCLVRDCFEQPKVQKLYREQYYEKKQKSKEIQLKKIQEDKERYDKKRKADRKIHIIKQGLMKKAKEGGFKLKKQKVGKKDGEL